MSVAAVGGPPRRRSGHRYSGVPASRSPPDADVCIAWPAPKSMRTTRPPSSRMTLCALTSPWTSPLAWTAASAPHSARPMTIASSALCGAARVDLGGQRPPVHELHPQADPALVLVGAVHDDDVGMLDAGEQPALVEDPRGQIVAAEARRQQLHGDVTAERIDGPIDLRERAAADRCLETQRAPGPAAQVAVGAARRRRRPDRFEGVVLRDGGHAGQHAEALDHRARRVVGGGPFLGFPVDWLALVDAGGELEEADRQVIVHHGSSP